MLHELSSRITNVELDVQIPSASPELATIVEPAGDCLGHVPTAIFDRIASHGHRWSKASRVWNIGDQCVPSLIWDMLKQIIKAASVREWAWTWAQLRGAASGAEILIKFGQIAVIFISDTNDMGTDIRKMKLVVDGNPHGGSGIEIKLRNRFTYSLLSNRWSRGFWRSSSLGFTLAAQVSVHVPGSHIAEKEHLQTLMGLHFEVWVSRQNS